MVPAANPKINLPAIIYHRFRYRVGITPRDATKLMTIIVLRRPRLKMWPAVNDPIMSPIMPELEITVFQNLASFSCSQPNFTSSMLPT